MKEGITVILLAGGVGQRMHSSTPKQFLTLGEKPLSLHSFEVFLSISEINEIVVVCSPSFRELFKTSSTTPVLFALPGSRRQDSVYNGLQVSSYSLICIHDAARPFINKELVLRALDGGKQCGAAAVGIPIKFTVKESGLQNFVQSTPDRTTIWEIQTPQVLHREIINSGFEYANHQGLTVTDDTSLAELIGKPVKLVEGCDINFKVTTPADLTIANHLLHTLKK